MEFRDVLLSAYGFVKVVDAHRENSIYGLYCITFNRDFLSVISRRIQHQSERNMIISNLSVGSQSSQNDRSGNDKNEKYFVTHRDAAA